MAKNFNFSPTDELRRYVERRASNDDISVTPSDFISELIRRDMQDWSTVRDVAQGLREARKRDFVAESILDVLLED